MVCVWTLPIRSIVECATTTGMQLLRICGAFDGHEERMRSLSLPPHSLSVCHVCLFSAKTLPRTLAHHLLCLVVRMLAAMASAPTTTTTVEPVRRASATTAARRLPPCSTCALWPACSSPMTTVARVAIPAWATRSAVVARAWSSPYVYVCVCVCVSILVVHGVRALLVSSP
jgi:hypothetical protein